MPMRAGEQQFGEGHTLTCRPQARHAQHCRQARSARRNGPCGEAAVGHLVLGNVAYQLGAYNFRLRSAQASVGRGSGSRRSVHRARL